MRMLPAIVAVLATACGPAAPPSTRAAPSSPGRSTPIVPLSPPACDAAEKRLADVATRLRGTESVADLRLACVLEPVANAARACPALVPRVAALADEMQERLRTPRAWWRFATTMSDDERWILHADGAENARVYARGGTSGTVGVSLALRVSLHGSVDLAPDGRLFVDESAVRRRLHVVDLATAEDHAFDDVDARAVVDGQLYVASDRLVRRYTWPALAANGAVASATSIVPEARAFRVVGRAFVAGDALVSFDPPRILAPGLSFGPASADGARIVACKPGPVVAVVDTASGVEIASFDVGKSAICAWTEPGLSPDGRSVVGVEDVVNGAVQRQMRTVVFDVESKTVTRRLDPVMSFSTALDARIEVRGEKPRRVCIDYGNLHWRLADCPWVLDGAGRIASAPASPRAKPSSAPAGETNLALATSPDGKLRVLAAAKARTGESDVYEHLVLRVVDLTSGKPLRATEIAAGPFTVNLHAQMGTLPPELRFLDPTHVLWAPNALPMRMGVFAVDTSAYAEFDSSTMPLHGRFAVVDAESGPRLLDMITGATSPLAASAADWRRAPELTASCE